MTRLEPMDLSLARRALDTEDPEQFAKAVEPLGLALTLTQFLSYVRGYEPSFASAVAAELLQLAYLALHVPAGFGFGVWQDCRTMLVVRSDDQLVFGVQPCKRNTPFPKTGWTMGRWYQDPVRTRATVETWAADPARAIDALTVRITRPAEPLAQPGDHRGDDLLAAVIADPDDLAVRLVYGDWLSEQGDVRGELIRVQCELQNAELDDGTRTALLARETVLLQHERAIVAPIAGLAEHVGIGRGLVEDVTINVWKLARNGQKLVANHPIRRLRVRVANPAELLQLGTLDFVRVPELAISGSGRSLWGDVTLDLGAIARAPMFATVRRLELMALKASDDDWTRFFTTLAAPKLEELVIDRPTFSSAVMPTLASLHTLRALTLDTPNELARSPEPLVQTLVALKLDRASFNSWGSALGDDVIARCISGLAPTLRELQIQTCWIAERTIAALGAAGRLERLTLTRNMGAELRHEDAVSVACTLPALRELVLDHSMHAVRDASALEAITRALCDAPPTLRVVRWRETVLSDEQRARIRERRMLVG